MVANNGMWVAGRGLVLNKCLVGTLFFFNFYLGSHSFNLPIRALITTLYDDYGA